MKLKRFSVLLMLLALVLAPMLVKPQPAQAAWSTTRLYGSAYTPAWVNGYPVYSPYSHVWMRDDNGNQYECNTDWRSNWWYDNLPANRYYMCWAKSNSFPYYSSSGVRVWVPARSIWPNQTRIPDLQCRY